MGYTKNTVKGISWISGSRFVSRALAFFKIAILARVLSPAQFGLFGIASLVLALLETLTETGINIVLIQSKGELKEYINTAWVVSILRGVFIALLLIIASSSVALFFHTPNAIGLLLFISLVPFIRGFINPSEVKFQKELNFHLQFWFSSGLFLIDTIVSVVFVLVTHSIYSLVWGMLISAIIEVILSLIFIKPRPKFAIEKGYFKEIFHKGTWVTGYTIFNYIAENADNAVVGRLLGASALGFYQMAYKISILPLTEISDVVSSVVFPVYAKIVDDGKRLQQAFFKTVFLVFFSSILLGIVIFSFPQQVIVILLGDKWLSIIPVLKILIIYGVLRTIAGPVSALLLSISKQKFVTVMVSVRFLTLALLIIPFVRSLGLVGAGYAQLFSVILELPVMSYFTYLVFNRSKDSKI